MLQLKPMSEKLGQLMIMGLRGKELTSEESQFIIKNNIGGVILFDRNIDSPLQLHKLCSDLHNLRHKTRDKIPLFVSIDMEGGRVARLKAPFTQWPALAKLGQLDSTSVAFQFGLMMGCELRAMGINLDYAPCVDVLTNPKNKVIGDRSLSTNPENVAKLASAVVRGYIKSEVIPCAKHFPGHGNTLVDSHDDLPVEDADLERLKNVELVPFKKAFRARLDLVMTAHIRFPKVDPEWPVTLSKKFLQEILRGELRYKNMVISDDLDMKALAKHYPFEQIPVRALQAGCDIVLYCNIAEHPPKALEAIGKALRDGGLKQSEIDEKYNRVVSLKKNMLAKPDPLPIAEATKFVGHPDHLKLSKAIQDGQIPQDLLVT